MPVTTLSPHIIELSKCGLIRIENQSMTHGIQKCCYLNPGFDQILIDFFGQEERSLVYTSDIPLGYFSDFSVTPTCGLASSTSYVGCLDEPRYFAHPNRLQARIIWFTTGYMEYILPNFIPKDSQINEITLTFEISSECPRYNNDWPSDISFFMNGIPLGSWVSPGDYGDRRGRLNPDWWFSFLNQYGLLKKLTINHQGTFISSNDEVPDHSAGISPNAEKLSDVTIDQLSFTDQSVMKFRIAVLPDSPRPHGCTLFGYGFGDYNQGINVTISYSNMR